MCIERVVALLLMLIFVGCQSTTTTQPVIPGLSSSRGVSRGNADGNTDGNTDALPCRTTDDNTLALVRFDQTDPSPVAKVDRDPQEILTLDRLEGIAFQNNPTLAAAAARIDAARGKQVQAGLYPNPVVGYHATGIGNLGTAGQQGGFIRQRLITGGKLRLDRAIAEKQLDEAYFRLHTQERRVLSDVRLRFYETLIAQRRVELARELARIGDELVAATKKLLVGQIGTENDLLQAEIRADESYILEQNAHNFHMESWRRLSAVVGIPTIQCRLAGKLDTELPYFDWDHCLASVLSGNPELDAARARVDTMCITVTRAKKEPIPDVDFFVSVRHHNVTDSDVVNLQVGVPIPVFNKNQGNIRAAEADLVAANQDVERIKLGLQDRLAVAYRKYANARQQADRYRETIVPKAAQSLEMVSDGFERGQLEYLTLLVSQQTYFNVNLAYLDSLEALWTASAEIEGQLLSGSLANRD